MSYYENDYTEREWRNDSDARESADIRDTERDMREWTPEETAASLRYLAIEGMGDDAPFIYASHDIGMVPIPEKKVA